MSDVFQEVDEELKKQRLDKALRAYGPVVAVVAIIGFASYAGYMFWQNQIQARADAAGQQLILGMEALGSGSQEAAAAIFAGIEDSAPGAYPSFARFNEASALRQAGDTASALAIYDAIVENSNTPASFRDLARFYGGLTALDNSSTTMEDIEARLSPVAEGDGPWRFHAREMLGFAAYRTGDLPAAAAHYQRLTDDPDTPVGVAARAAEMLALSETISE